MQQNKTNRITFWILAIFLILFIEIMFFQNGSVLFILIGSGFIYFGVRKVSRILFWLGIFFLIISIFSMWSLRIFIVAAIVYTMIQLWKGHSIAHIISPFSEMKNDMNNSPIQQKLFSIQHTPFYAYEWQDIHVQGIYGNVTIDLTQTVLPKETSLISTRYIVGKVKIIVPYEVPVRIYYSSLVGEAQLFDKSKQRVWNNSIFHKDGYDTANIRTTELIITVATLFGDIEVINQ